MQPGKAIFSLVVAFALMALPPSPGWADQLGGVTMPDQTTVGGKTLQLNGMGVRKKLWIQVYVAGLYLENPTQEAARVVATDQIKQVRMHFTTGLATKSKMDDAWDEGFEANNPQAFGKLKPRVEAFKSYFGDMKDGDSVEITYVPDRGTTVTVNGAVKGTIEGKDFSEALMRVWFGDHPPTAPLKQGMLGR